MMLGLNPRSASRNLRVAQRPEREVRHRATALDVPVYEEELWTSRQRQASPIHEISYRACFKPQLPRFFIDRLTAAGDVVHDPFMGRGTTPLEAAIAGRRPAGDWREEFPNEILTMLCEHNIDLDLGSSQGNGTAVSKLGLLKRLRPRRLQQNLSRLSARFEFSMLPADGGFIRPHTDSPQKIITLVIGILRQGEWNPSFGGGTEVLRPKDPTNNFNFKNSYLEFEDVETLTTFEYSPNNCVIFIKTFNSLHAVRPMTAPDHNLMRKTLTINIEKA
jgi:hypothetical protein